MARRKRSSSIHPKVFIGDPGDTEPTIESKETLPASWFQLFSDGKGQSGVLGVTKADMDGLYALFLGNGFCLP